MKIKEMFNLNRGMMSVKPHRLQFNSLSLRYIFVYFMVPGVPIILAATQVSDTVGIIIFGLMFLYYMILIWILTIETEKLFWKYFIERRCVCEKCKKKKLITLAIS